jgi:hypothetical protein
MDIRVSAYSPATTVTTASRAGNPLATAYVQNASQSGPVTAAEAIRPVQNNLVAANPSDGYTDSVRGSIINILA